MGKKGNKKTGEFSLQYYILCELCDLHHNLTSSYFTAKYMEYFIEYQERQRQKKRENFNLPT